MVAKTYQSLPQLCEPYLKNKRLYIRVQTNSGQKEVRWYNEQEYKRLYPNNKVPDSSTKSLKGPLGFSKGPITIFKGATALNEEWFERSICRYATLWGWYVASTDLVPEDIPTNLVPIQLHWDEVSEALDAGNKSAVISYVEKLLYSESQSNYLGEIKSRIEWTATLYEVNTFDSYYGEISIFEFVDSHNNKARWKTSTSPHISLNQTYRITGTIKDHLILHREKVTELTRCKIGGC